MNRRTFIVGLGGSAVPALAGCTTDDDDTYEYIEPSDDSDTQSDEQEMHAHLFDVLDLVDITADSLTVTSHVTTNPDGPYEIHAYETPLSEWDGEWSFEMTMADYVGQESPVFDEENEEWYLENGIYRQEFVINERGSKVGAVEIPADDPSVSESVSETPTGGLSHLDTKPLFEIEFELDDEPPLFEPVIYTFVWEGPNLESPLSGEVVTRTPQILRVNDNQFYYPEWHANQPLEIPWWRDRGFEDTWGHQDNEGNGPYITEVTNGNTWTGQIARVSNYGRFSEKYHEIASDGTDKGLHLDVSQDMASSVGPTYLDGAIQNPWGIEYEIDQETVDEATAIAERNSNDYYSQELMNYITEDRIINHSVVQDIAAELGNVCERINATRPTEQLRVVSDFVQYIDYSFDPQPPFSRAKHPVELLTDPIGDCVDFTVLAYALLQQEPFDFTTSVGVFEDVSWYEDYENVQIDHTSIGVSMDDLEITDLVDDQVIDSLPDWTQKCWFEDEGEMYMYIEMSSPDMLGLITDDDDYEVPPTPLRERM